MQFAVKVALPVDELTFIEVLKYDTENAPGVSIVFDGGVHGGLTMVGVLALLSFADSGSSFLHEERNITTARNRIDILLFIIIVVVRYVKD